MHINIAGGWRLTHQFSSYVEKREWFRRCVVFHFFAGHIFFYERWTPSNRRRGDILCRRTFVCNNVWLR